MSRPKKRKGGRVTPKGTGSTKGIGAGADPVRSSRPGGPMDISSIGPLDGPWADDPLDEIEGDEPDVLGYVGDAVASGHAAELLVLASTVADAIDEAERLGPLGDGVRDEGDGDGDQVDDGESDEPDAWSTAVEEFIGAVRPETTALLYALRPLAPDEWRKRISAELASRHTPSLPTWIALIADAEVTGIQARDVSGDEVDVFVGVRWPGGQEMTVIVHVDRADGGMVDDVMLTRTGIDVAIGAFLTEMDGSVDLDELVAVDLAEARAGLEAGVRRWETAWPQPSSDDWPSARPLLMWLLSTLPDGGDPARLRPPEGAAEET